MECPKCKQEVVKIIISQNYMGCAHCREFPQDTPAWMNRKAGNKYAPWLTQAGNDVITFRTISPDDKRTIIDMRTGRESPQLTSD